MQAVKKMIKLLSDFFNHPGGVWIFSLFMITVLFILADVTYRSGAKVFLDGVLALIMLIITSPLFLICSLISRARSGEILEKEAYLGYKGKIIYLNSFACVDGCLKNLPRLLDVLRGKLSFTGVKLLKLSDGVFINEEYLDRFNARPGIFCHLSLNGGKTITYEQMFAADAIYAKHREIVNDIAILLTCAAKAVSGKKKSYMGEARDNSYAEVLSKRGKITKTDCELAERYAEEAVLENSAVIDYKRTV